MYHTFHKSGSRVAVPVRQREPRACHACQRNQLKCSGHKPNCQQCVSSTTPCFYSTAWTSRTFKVKTAAPDAKFKSRINVNTSTNTPELFPGGSSPDAQGGTTLLGGPSSASTVDQNNNFSELLSAPASAEDDSNHVNGSLDEILWFNISSPVLAEESVGDNLLSDSSSDTFIPTAKDQSQHDEKSWHTASRSNSCLHDQKIDHLLTQAMSYHPLLTESCPTESLGIARDGITDLQIIRSCNPCLSSCRSMTLTLSIAQFFLSRFRSLLTTHSSVVEIQLGSYTAKATDECLGIYQHIVRLQIGKLIGVVCFFAKYTRNNGWIAHASSWDRLASDLQDLT